MMRKLSRAALVAACCASAAAQAADWPFHRQNFRGDGNSGEPLTTAQAQTFTQKWVFNTAGWNYANPIVVGGTIYLTSGDGQLYVIDAATGKQKWAHRVSIVGPFPCLPQSQAKGPIGAPAVVGTDVFMPGADGYVYDFDGPTGAIKWKTLIADVKGKGEFLWTSSFPLDGKVFYGISATIDCLMPPGRVVALSQSTGQVVGTWWGGGPSHQPGAGVWDQPAYDAATNRMFLTTGTIANGLVQSQEPWADAFVAVDPGTYQTVDSYAPIGASFSADFDFGAGPTLYDTSDGRHLVAAANKNGYVYALNRDNLAGGVLWTYQISGPGASPDLGESAIAPAAFAKGLLFVGGGKTVDGFPGAVAALDGATGRAQWVFHPNGFVLGGIIVAGDTIVVGTAQAGTLNGIVYVLDQQTGNVLWQKSVGAIMGAPTYSNGVLYVPDLKGALYAFAPAGSPPPPPPPPGAFTDDFNRTSLGSNWLVAHGQFSDNGSAAVGTGAQAYAFWDGTPAADAPVAIDLAKNASTYVGVTARANGAHPDANHYAAYVGPDRHVSLARRANYTYTYLVTGPVMASGTHRLQLTASGASPVVLSVAVDGTEVIHYTDSSSAAYTTGGLAGIFDYSGKGQPLDNFSVGTASSGGGGGGGGGGTVTIASDEFGYTGALQGWQLWSGSFSAANGQCSSTAARSYATKGSAVTGDVTVSATVATGGSMSYFGVIARASPSSGARDHYAAWMNADGSVHLGRANNWSYSYLQDAPPVASGAHKLTLHLQGTGPVHATVLVDGNPVLDYVDSSSQALTGAGLAGIFSWQGAGPTFDHFLATQP